MHPRSTSVRTQSTHRTGLAICSTNALRIPSPVSTACPDAFETSGTSGSFHAMSAIASAIRACTGFMSSLWNAAPTWRRTTLAAPASCASAISASTADSSPETTICVGELRFARATEPDAASEACTQSSASWSAGRPITAAIAPGRSDWVSAMRRPRSATSRIPSSVDSAPDETAAVYSPRLCPATSSGRRFIPRAASVIASESANSAGWATSVRVSSSIGPSRESRRIGKPDASSAAAR